MIEKPPYTITEKSADPQTNTSGLDDTAIYQFYELTAEKAQATEGKG